MILHRFQGIALQPTAVALLVAPFSQSLSNFHMFFKHHAYTLREWEHAGVRWAHGR
jgi:hypothetical protein